MKKRYFFLTIIIFFLLIILSSAFYLFHEVQPVTTEKEAYSVKINVPSGISVYSVSELMETEKIIKNSRLFYICAKYPFLTKLIDFNTKGENQFVLKSGLYTLTSDMTYPQLMKTLSSGLQEYIKVSIPEGLTITKIGEILENNNVCSQKEFVDFCYNKVFVESFGINNESLEGYLFPDTYFFTSGMEVPSIIKIMVDNFFDKLSTIEGSSNLSKSELNDMVILASIVEREYQVDDEAPLIASVFKNRLKNNIGLYSCATIEYIITEIQHKPHPEQILIEDTKIDNPYNTYKWAGLTPGPISNPGLVALSAAINAPKTNYYFFQVVDSSSGRHVFTETFEQHKVNHNLNLKK